MPAPHDAYGRQPGQPASFVKEDGYLFEYDRGWVGAYAHDQQWARYQQQHDVGDHMGAEIDMHAQEMEGRTGCQYDQADSGPKADAVLCQ